MQLGKKLEKKIQNFWNFVERSVIITVYSRCIEKNYILIIFFGFAKLSEVVIYQ